MINIRLTVHLKIITLQNNIHDADECILAKNAVYQVHL